MLDHSPINQNSIDWDSLFRVSRAGIHVVFSKLIQVASRIHFLVILGCFLAGWPLGAVFRSFPTWHLMSTHSYA